MSRVVRPSSVALFAVVFALAFVARTTTPLLGQAPASGSRPAPAAGSRPAPATAADVKPFVGDWLVSVAVMANEATFAVSVKADGKPSATIKAEGQPTVDVSDISMAGKSLVLRYISQGMGQPMPTTLTLTPAGSDLRVSMAVMDGQYEMAGSATKQAPGAPVRASGFGGRGGSPSTPATDFSARPPYKPRTPAEEAAGFMLPTGYRMELVASDPDVISPSVIEFDGNGRMYVVEMISYMMDAEASREHDPISRISRWESTKGDGVYDKHTVFADHLVAPRMILPLQDGVILTSETDSDDIIKLTDSNGDGVADKREVVFTGIGQSGDANIEHQKAGLMWGMDNWIYTTYNPFRIRWTPTGFLREPTGPNGGQWGLGMDDDGKPWFVDAGGERGPMNFQYPIHYGAFTPCPAIGGRITGVRAGGPPPPPNSPACPDDFENGFEKGFSVVWPAPGIADMQGGINRIRMPARNLNHFTAATGPAIVRGDRLPSDLKGDLLFTEPVGRLIRRASIENVEGLTELRNVYPNAEFVTSDDQLFRPVNISNAPDGTVYIADMYHGIIQERQWSGPGTYLRAKIEQYQLDKVASYGRIWRIRYDGREAVPATDTNPGQPAIPAITPAYAPPRMYSETPAQLVAHFTHPNGWWRDTAQRLLILKQDKSVVPALQQMLRAAGPAPATSEGADSAETQLVARFHALWTLEGLNALDAATVRQLMKDPNPRMRVQAIRASETLYKAGDKTLADDYRAMTKDADTNVAIQAMLTTNLFKLPDAADVIKATQASHKARGVTLIAEHLLAPAPAGFGGGRGRSTFTSEEEARLEAGSNVFNSVCFACHGSDGMGKALEGAAPGTLMAPPLAGSPRVQGHRDYVIKVLLRGLTGPIDGKTYHDVMVPMGGTDEWVAGIASFVRNSFGNNAGMVTPADVARVKAAIADRKDPWTVPELEASLPRVVDPQKMTLTASPEGDGAAGAATLRGWSAGDGQTPGTSLTVALPEAVPVTEVQFDSVVTMPRFGRGGAPPAGPTTPTVGYPRGYSVEVSTDGTTWSKPVATGKGSGAHTTIAFNPTPAKFVRITQTENAPDAPAWSVKSLRVYQAPSAK